MKTMKTNAAVADKGKVWLGAGVGRLNLVSPHDKGTAQAPALRGKAAQLGRVK